MTGGDNGDSHSAVAQAASQAAAMAGSYQQQQEGPASARDIITGELLPAGAAASQEAAAPSPEDSPAPGRRPRGGSSSGKLGEKPPRDIRLEPVRELAKWLPGSSGPRRTRPGPGSADN